MRPLDGNTARFYKAKVFLDSHPWLRKNGTGRQTIDILNNKTEKQAVRIPTQNMGITQLRKLADGKVRNKDGKYIEPITPISEETKKKARAQMLKLQARVIKIMGE